MLDQHQKEFIQLIKENSHRHRPHQVFSDFCELASLSISNAVDRRHYQKREERYMQLIQGYSKEELNRFARMLACVTNSLEAGIDDCLGQIFMGMDLGSDFKGQFFTPFEVSYLMASVIGGDEEEIIKANGYFSVMEPACGAGGMLMAKAKVLLDKGINYQVVMHATAIDIDVTAAHMTYIQLSLLHIPAIIIHGNALSNEYWSYWLTPAHQLGFWDHKLNTKAKADIGDFKITPDEMPQVVVEAAAAAAEVAKEGSQMALF